MTHRFDDIVLTAVLAHMNDDHTDDNLLIARAFLTAAETSADAAVPDIATATMVGFDGDGGEWMLTSTSGDELRLRVPWPGGPIDGRPDVRRQIVALYDEACRRLGIEPRPHD